MSTELEKQQMDLLQSYFDKIIVGGGEEGGEKTDLAPFPISKPIKDGDKTTASKEGYDGSRDETTTSKKKDVDFEFERSGAFSIAASPDQVKRQSNSVRSLVPHGYEGQMLVGRDAVLKQFPGLGENTTAIGASTWPLSCHVNPKALTHVIAEEAENLGVYISEETPVTEIRCLHKSERSV